MQEFNGFQKEFVDFLIGLSFKNTVENQSENLISYKKFITEPLGKLYNELLPVVCEINSALEKNLQGAFQAHIQTDGFHLQRL